MWIADLKVLLRKACDKYVHTECFWRQFVPWKYLWHHNYSISVEKMVQNTNCFHQMLAVICRHIGCNQTYSKLLLFVFTSIQPRWSGGWQLRGESSRITLAVHGPRYRQLLSWTQRGKVILLLIISGKATTGRKEKKKDVQMFLKRLFKVFI